MIAPLKGDALGPIRDQQRRGRKIQIAHRITAGHLNDRDEAGDLLYPEGHLTGIARTRGTWSSMRRWRLYITANSVC